MAMISAIQFDKVSKVFGPRRKRRTALSDLSLTVQSGEVFGFLGPNGAGKSTSIKLLLNFIRPDQGTLRIKGKLVGCEEFRQDLGYLSEFPCFYNHLTAAETLDFAGRLSAMPARTLKKRRDRLLDKVDLAGAARQRVGTFSKGMKQRLGCAMSLIHDPDILIFDEPMSGLDPVGRHLIKELILELRQQGKTVFFSSHILSDIEDLCDRIGILHKGNLLYQGELAQFTQSAPLEKAFIMAIKEWEDAAAA